MRTLAAGLCCALVLPASAATTVTPGRVEAGSFYSGATLRVRGSIGERSQVAIRVTGPREHHHFNRRGRIGGIIWGGIEHVTFRHAPSLYALHTSAALEALAPAALREELELGTDTLEARIDVQGRRSDKAQLVEHFVRLKESEGLYQVAPGAVRLGEAQQGRRAFEASVRLPGAAPPGEIEVAVLELAAGALAGEEVTRVRIERVGVPAFLTRMAHERSALFGVLTVVALVLTGVGVDLLGSRRSARPHPAAVVLSGIGRGFDDALLAARHRPRSPAQVEELHRKYRLFRTLLSLNGEVLENLADLEEESTWTSFRHTRVRMGIRALFDGTADMVSALNELTSQRYFDLRNVVATLRADVFKFLEKSDGQGRLPLVLRSEEIDSDTAARVGDKAVGLARIESDLGVRVPGWFAVTVDAYRELLESGGIASQLRSILSPARLDEPGDLGRRCQLARATILEAAVPAPVAGAIEDAYRASGFPGGEGLAVRSSAAGEGGELSFAGQFESYLNVPASQLVETWKKVVASRFSPRAVFYRRAAGLAEVDTPMAVLVQRMVRSQASGVAFTRPPDDAKAPGILVAAARGLGPDVSLGIASADQLVVSRSFPHRILDRRIAPKRARLQPDDHGGVRRLAVAPLEQLQASITDAQAAQLARAALEIERYFGTPQDIEWAFDEAGELFVLQARALRTGKAGPAGAEVARDAPVLLRGGEPVWPGRAVGPVHVARTPEEEDETPSGALLVVPQLLPDCVRLLPRVCGIVVERGTITGHAASILREFRIPSLFGLTGATDQLVPGQVVSLDVASCAIFDGALWPELRGQLPARILGGRTAGLPELLAGKLTKLSGSAFVGTWACQSLHDVIRFAHEMAIQSMFEIGDRLLESPIGGVKKLDCPPPLFLHVLDLGGGLKPAAGKTVKPGEIACAPFQALWRGLGDAHFHPPKLPNRAGPMELSLAASMVTAGPTQLGAPNYACVTSDYLNLNSRAGLDRDLLGARPRRQAYHYVVVDSVLCESENENHISLRLKGGGAAPAQRRLRAELVAEVLRRAHFTVGLTGDLVNGWIRGVGRAACAERLATVGRLLRFLPRLDMWMEEERDVERYVEAFFEAEASARAVTPIDRGAATA